jgi:hypothetical protein
MTSAPYPISGTVKDVDGSTALKDVTVTLYNVTKEKWLNASDAGVSDASGHYTLDLANIIGGYEDDDKLQVVAMDSTGTKVMEFRHTVDTDTGSLSQDIVMHPGIAVCSTCRLTTAVVANSHSGGLYVDFYDRKNDTLIMRVEVPAGDTVPLHFGYARSGKLFDGGICIIYEDTTAGRLTVALNIDGA